MNQSTLWILIAISTALAIFLIIYNLKSWKKLQTLKNNQKEIERQQDAQLNESQLKAQDSIQVIAQCMLDEQVELSEGCIRIKVLLDHVAPELHDDPQFQIFAQMYAWTEHMPTHAARKQADKKLIRKLDKERWQLEDLHKTTILTATKKLLGRKLR